MFIYIAELLSAQEAIWQKGIKSGLIKSGVVIWEKDRPALRQVINSQEPDMLNFHHRIKDRLLKKYIKYSRSKSYTLSVVHTVTL